MKFSLIILGIVAAVLAGAYFLMNREPLECNEVARLRMGGTYATTKPGITHYELSGSENAPLVVLVHGVSGPMKVWDKTVVALNNAGFRTLRYDLYGRGMSDRLLASYDEEFYDTQLAELLKMLNIQSPVVLVGSSMGAVISAGFHNRHPELVSRVVLIGPAGFSIQASPISKLMYVPLIGEYIMGVFGAQNLKSHHWKYFVKPEAFPEMHEAFAHQLQYSGTKGAILSTMRHMPVQNFQKGYEELGRSKTPVLLLWGREDVTFPFSNNEKARTYIPQAQFVAIDYAAHLPQYENPEPVSSEIVGFLADLR